jgi:hypothetical protein
LIDYYGINTAPLQFRGQGKPGRSRADYKNLIFGSDIEHETPSSFFGRGPFSGRTTKARGMWPPQ